MRFCPSAGGIPFLLKCNYLFPFVCFCFPRPSLLRSFPVLSYIRLLALTSNPTPLLPVSMRAYLLSAAPGGYLSFSPLHCDCHGDTQIPRSTGPDPHPFLHKALTLHLRTWGCRSQNLLLWSRGRRRRSGRREGEGGIRNVADLQSYGGHF